MTDADDVARLRRQLERERRIRKQAEVIAEDATRRLYDADRMKSLFVTTVSHELRTPLTPILGFAEGLADKWDTIEDATRRDIVDRIHQNAATLRLLIDSLLDFSQLENAQVAISVETLAISKEVERVIDQLEAISRRHVLETELDPSVIVRADRTAVARIVSNLVSNAVKYSPDGGRVRVLTNATDTAGVLAVEDDGPGIDPEERERIFQRFYRSSGETVARARGLGIGLALVRALAEAMGGDAGVDEAPSGGARFWVSFPLASTQSTA